MSAMAYPSARQPSRLPGDPERALDGVSAPPILIPGQEVAFSAATALGLLQPKTSRWWLRATRVIAAAPRRLFLTSTADSLRPQRYSPRRYSFLENAIMAREMDRL
jgi:hypothetical protein